jgi:hypothetical protein
MTTRILCTPQAWPLPPEGELLTCLDGRYTSVVYNWHPCQGLTPGALHVTHLHPIDLEYFGHLADAAVRGWRGEPGWSETAPTPAHTPTMRAPTVRPLPRPALRSVGHADSGLLIWIGAIMVCLLVGAAGLLDGAPDGADDAQHARALESAQWIEQRQAAHASAMQERCGPNAAWVQASHGRTWCADKRGRVPRPALEAAP